MTKLVHSQKAAIIIAAIGDVRGKIEHQRGIKGFQKTLDQLAGLPSVTLAALYDEIVDPRRAAEQHALIEKVSSYKPESTYIPVPGSQPDTK